MHAAVFRYEGVVGPVEELLPAGRRMAAALGKVPGFVNHVVLDGGSGVLLTISIFENAADLEAAERLIAMEATRLRSIGWPAATRLTGGEVIIQRGL